MATRNTAGHIVHHQRRASGVRDTPGIALGICQHRAARQQDQHILLRAQNPRGVLHGMRINHRRSKCGQCISNHTAFVHDVSDGRISVAICPGEVRAA